MGWQTSLIDIKASDVWKCGLKHGFCCKVVATDCHCYCCCWLLFCLTALTPKAVHDRNNVPTLLCLLTLYTIT